ncbi:lipoprotein, partial [Mycoplasma capricolum]|uniref:lipoprotein n=1 Tax=Mycoplasma capricolum TaxID=2095 RepID=UPI0018AFFFA4
MKKLLTLLGSIGMVASTAAVAVACGDRSNTEMNNSGNSDKPSEMTEDKKNGE